MPSDPVRRSPGVSVVSIAFIMEITDLTLMKLNVIRTFDVRLKRKRSCFSGDLSTTHFR